MNVNEIILLKKTKENLNFTRKKGERDDDFISQIAKNHSSF